jgi:hypothetical protein
MDWIKVSDRLPKNEEKVLIFYEFCLDSHIVDTAVFINKDKYENTYFQLTRPDEYYGWCVSLQDALFWQPFQEPQKEPKEANVNKAKKSLFRMKEEYKICQHENCSEKSTHQHYKVIESTDTYKTFQCLELCEKHRQNKK